MKLLIKFGIYEDGHLVTWWSGIEQFPILITYTNRVYEQAYRQAGSKYMNSFLISETTPDYEIYYHIRTSTYNHNTSHIPTFENMFPGSRTYIQGCECGANASWDNSHMFYCKKWKAMGSKE